ncbi:MAG TPA: hypothetical protein VH374_13795 [Polyangia bacterium]|jgi:hypothetical protein|nr:hypothetical protein [Polyangia bacterium]
MRRLLFAGVLALLLAVSPALWAQLTDGPPMPAALDLHKAPVGSWAEYKIGIAALPTMTTRMALVARAKNLVTLEMTVDGGVLAAAGGKMTLQTTVDADTSKAGAVKKLVMQMGPNDPMEMPPETAQHKQFEKPDPKSFVNDEMVTVAGGTFKAKHYRQKTAKGDPLEFWISGDVPPFGLVKIQGQQTMGPPGGTAAPAAISFELQSHGKSAASVITTPVKPFDQQVFMGQMTNTAKAMSSAAAAKTPPAK